jgi:hypothetical protein
MWSQFFERDQRSVISLLAIDEADLSESGRRLRRETIYELRECERRMQRRAMRVA